MLAVCLLLGGCGGGTSTPPEGAAPATTATATTSSTTIATVTPATTETTPPTPSLGAPRVTTISAHTPDGYSVRAKFTAYDLVAADQPLPALPYSGRSSIGACDINPQTDAVIPIAFTLTNTTPRFSGVLGLSLGLGYDFDNETEVIEGDDAIGGSPSCNSYQQADFYYSAVWNDATPPGGTVRDDFFLILHDYYGPTRLAGDPSLAGLKLVPELSVGPQSTRENATTDVEIQVMP